jgi:hypothetical protein
MTACNARSARPKTIRALGLIFAENAYQVRLKPDVHATMKMINHYRLFTLTYKYLFSILSIEQPDRSLIHRIGSGNYLFTVRTNEVYNEI